MKAYLTSLIDGGGDGSGGDGIDVFWQIVVTTIEVVLVVEVVVILVEASDPDDLEIVELVY